MTENRLRALGRGLAAVMRQLFATLLIASIIVCLGLSFRIGFERGKDGVFSPHAVGGLVDGVCATLSKAKFGTGSHVCASAAEERMRTVGLHYEEATLARIGKTRTELLLDTAFMNKALRQLFDAPASPGAHPVRGIGWGGDAGYADFVELSFFLFGPRIESFYLTFFFLIALSTCLFCIQFARNYYALFACLSFHYTLLSYLALHFIDGWGVGTVGNPRFLTTFAIVPVLHALFLLGFRTPASPTTVLVFLMQAALMILAANLRTTAYWALIAILFYCALLVGGSLLRRDRRRDGVWSRIWPGYLVATAGLCGILLVSWAEDPRLSSSGGMRTHSIWASNYYALQQHPGWKDKYAEQHLFAQGDGPAMVAKDFYAQRHNLPPPRNMQEMDEYIRGAYIEFVLNDPGYVVETIAYYNGSAIARTVGKSFLVSVWLALSWPFVALCLCVAGALIVDVRRRRESWAALTSCTAILILFAVLSAGPNWALLVIESSLGDVAFMAALASFMATLWALVSLGVLERDAFRLNGNRHCGSSRRTPAG